MPDSNLTEDRDQKVSHCMDTVETVSQILDAREWRCPMPLLKAKQALNRMVVGEVLEVWATDSGSFNDFHAWTRQTPHKLLLAEERGHGQILEYCYRIEKGC